MPSTLILGGARSGKSRRAQTLALRKSDAPIYVATAPLFADDEEWQQRIHCHRAERGAAWRLIEEQLDLLAVLKQEAVAGSVVLVDCLTLWLFNLSNAGRDIDAEVGRLAALLPTLAGEVLLVANELGMGLVPEQALGRAFRDAQGRLNQQIAAAADRVEFVVAGLPLMIKGEAKA